MSPSGVAKAKEATLRLSVSTLQTTVSRLENCLEISRTEEAEALKEGASEIVVLRDRIDQAHYRIVKVIELLEKRKAEFGV